VSVPWTVICTGNCTCYVLTGDTDAEQGCPTIIYRLNKYRDTGIPRYFVTSSIA